MSRQLLIGCLAGVFLFGSALILAERAPTTRDVVNFVNVYNHPKTGFSCADKQAGQYYADPQTKCAVYYVCIPSPGGGLIPQSFACPNGTIFSQATRVCRPHDEIYCPLAERYYDNTRGAIDVIEEQPALPVAPEAPSGLAHPPARPATRQRPASHPRTRIPEAPRPQPVQELPPPPPAPVPAPQPVQRQRSAQSARLAPQALPPQPLPVPIAPAPVPAPLPSPAVTRQASGGRFRSRLGQSPPQPQPFQLPSTTSTTTTTTTTPAPPPPPPAPAAPAPAQPGQPANFEYDYGDYTDDQDPNAGPKQAASELSEQIAELTQFLKPEMKIEEVFQPLQRRRRDVETVLQTAKDKDDKPDTDKETAEMIQDYKDAVEKSESPSTFTCYDKISGLAYADIENDCSGYFMCMTVAKGKMQAVKLDCGPDEKFHQASGVCMTKVSKKECQLSEQYYFYDKAHKPSKKHLIASAAKKFAMSL